jgi:hypothetical protein
VYRTQNIQSVQGSTRWMVKSRSRGTGTTRRFISGTMWLDHLDGPLRCIVNKTKASDTNVGKLQLARPTDAVGYQGGRCHIVPGAATCHASAANKV